MTRLSPATAWSNWYRDDRLGILNRWEKWHGSKVNNKDIGLLKNWTTVMESKAVSGVATFLLQGTLARGCHQVTVLWPAELAQLPWEALDRFAENKVDLQRATSLSAWRRCQGASQNEPSATVMYAQKDETLIFRQQDTKQAGAFWQVPVPSLHPEPHEELTAYDVIQQLNTHGDAHVLMHGQYVVDDPINSHLKSPPGC